MDEQNSFQDGLKRQFSQPASPDIIRNDDDHLGTVRWFGRSWGAPVCDPRTHIPTPIGMPCDRCPALIEHFDQGITIPYVAADGVSTIAHHLDCWLTSLGLPLHQESVTIYQDGEWLLPPEIEP